MVRTAAEAAVAAMRSAVTGEPIEPDPDDLAQAHQGPGDAVGRAPSSDREPATASMANPQDLPQPGLDAPRNQPAGDHRPNNHGLNDQTAGDRDPIRPLDSVQPLNQPQNQASSTLPQNRDLGDFIEASGLLSYDPAAITRIYDRPPPAADSAPLANPGADRPLPAGGGH
jgi:hypothetical protein